MADELNQLDAPAKSGVPESAIATASHVAKFDRTDGLSFAATFVLTLGVYLFTIAPDVTLDFSGLLSTGALYAGIPHPAGYPLWTIYSWVFAKLLPLFTIAWRVSVGSAAAAAAASGMVALIVSCGGKVLMEDSAGFEHLTPRNRKWVRIVCGYVVGMALGLSGIVWRKAVIVDIWTFSLLLFTSILCLSLRWMIQPEKKRFLCAGFLMLGLLLTSSQEMIVALPGLVLVAMLGDRDLGRDLALTVLPLAGILTRWNQFSLWIDFPRLWNTPILIAFAVVATLGLAMALVTCRFGTKWKFVLLCNVSLFLGFSLCLYLPLASMTNPPLNWGYPRTVEGFFHVLSRGQYERMSPTADLAQYANQLWLFVKMSGKELGWLFLFLAAVPFCKLPQVNHRARKWFFALVMMFISIGPVLIADVNGGPDRTSQGLVMFYFMPAFAVLAVLAGLGLMLTLQAKAKRPAS